MLGLLLGESGRGEWRRRKERGGGEREERCGGVNKGRGEGERRRGEGGKGERKYHLLVHVWVSKIELTA